MFCNRNGLLSNWFRKQIEAMHKVFQVQIFNLSKIKSNAHWWWYMYKFSNVLQKFQYTISASLIHMIWLMNWVVKAVIQVLLLISITRLWTENCWFSRIITSISASWAIYKWKQFYGTHNLIYILGCIQFSTIFARGLIQISEMTRAVHGLRHVLFLSID